MCEVTREGVAGVALRANLLVGRSPSPNSKPKKLNRNG